jgi:hypothetical protein
VPSIPENLRSNQCGLEGRYVCFRPTFTNPEVINAYLVVIRWDEKRSCLIFEEQSRPDSMHTQQGLVYVPDGKPFMSLVTIDKGSMRLLMVARPDGGFARGLIMTLSNPGGTHLIPATAPLVLRRLGETSPQLGFVHRNAPDYDLYLMQLRSVAPQFGILADVVAASAEERNAPRDSPGKRLTASLPRPVPCVWRRNHPEPASGRRSRTSSGPALRGSTRSSRSVWLPDE